MVSLYFRLIWRDAVNNRVLSDNVISCDRVFLKQYCNEFIKERMVNNLYSTMIIIGKNSTQYIIEEASYNTVENRIVYNPAFILEIYNHTLDSPSDCDKTCACILN